MIRVSAEIRFQQVSFLYEPQRQIFSGLTLDLPAGITSLVGQNGVGKSTFLLLAGGVILPESGSVFVRGHDTSALFDEEQRHLLVSFVPQNLEFETERPIGSLLDEVYASGCHRSRSGGFVSELIEVFELASFLGRRTQEVSKGELQRTILAFSLLYGSPVLLLDEPIFALEDAQKERVMAYLCDYARRHGLCLLYSVHELDLSQRFSDYLLLFPPGAHPRFGRTPEMFTREKIEEAYQVPYVMLRRKEEIFRQRLIDADRAKRRDGSA
ncbi:MAG TPA: ABC transporter ATP-binding protein [Spirochaetia bacterium]|nr:ABC transporter ATP-binding protein [Spirochaetia bacterium]